jgi:RHS repeat-associated protein
VNSSGILPRPFLPLSPGSIRPRGWLLNQLQIQASGLGGHVDGFWPDVAESGWIGGRAEAWERGPYWLDGLIPLAFLLDDERLRSKVRAWTDHILEHQHRDGGLPLGQTYHWPEIGRFIQQDPIGDGGNWYAYVENNPLTGIDPEGLKLRFFGDRASINQALAYIARSPRMKDLINDLRYSRTEYRIVANSGQEDRYVPGTRTVHWDPHGALLTTCGGRQNPALGLGHELGHAHGPWERYRLDPQYDDNEERRVIVHVERPLAVFLKEDARYDHGGTPYWAPTPTSR